MYIQVVDNAIEYMEQNNPTDSVGTSHQDMTTNYLESPFQCRIDDELMVGHGPMNNTGKNMVGTGQSFINLLILIVFVSYFYTHVQSLL